MARNSQTYSALGPALGATACVLLAACPSNINGKVNSGKDHREKGAKKIKIEDNEGTSRRDIVTYPGGDRIDWKVFELPEGPRGSLRIKVRHRPARPGLGLAFRVYDQYFARLGKSKSSQHSRRTKSVVVNNAGQGKYYVQVYAPTRGDAASYKIEVTFTPGAIAQTGDIPDPPKLPAIPEAEEPPPDGAVPKPCPNDPTKVEPNCAPVPCPNDPTKFQPNCAATKVRAKVIRYQLTSSGSLIITINKGKNAGIKRGWTGQVVNSSNRRVQGGDFKVTKVTGSESVGKVKLSVDQIRANKKVILQP